MFFSDFSLHLAKIEATTKRLEMTVLLADLFKKLEKDEIAQACYLLQGKLVPKYESKEFQISEKMIIRILGRMSGQQKKVQLVNRQTLFEETESVSAEEEIRAQFKKTGDLGIVAEQVIQSSSMKSKETLDISQVFTKLTEIADTNGAGSQEKKVQLTIKLLEKSDSLSAKYIVRIMIGKLRLGFSDMTMIDALSWSLSGDKSLRSAIEDGYQKRADVGRLVHDVLEKGKNSLTDIHVEVGIPVVPALCQRINTAQEIIEKMGTIYAEPKYDGMRVQIHVKKIPNSNPLAGGQIPKIRKDVDIENLKSKSENIKSNENFLVKTFTRNLEESSHMFPELARVVEELDCESCILDSEAISYDPKTGKLQPFQQTIQRKRKHEVEATAKDIPLRFFVFDILEKDGKSLIDHPLVERKKTLQSVVFGESKTFIVAPYIVTDDPKKLHAYHELQLSEGLEGAVMKKVDSKYQSGRKGYSWVKIKESEGNRGKLSDTIDCIVLGYFKATGDRVSFEIGSLLLGVLNQKEEIVTISKVGSGIAEDLAKSLLIAFKPHVVSKRPNQYKVDKKLNPDVWLSPGVVVEIAADEITKSPSHTAGVALRFPRIIKIRHDKNWSEATTLGEVRQMMG